MSGKVRIGGEDYEQGVMAVAKAGTAMTLSASKDSRVMVIGGDNPGERHIWWNLVSSSRERIEKAKDDWREGRFAMVPGDDEFIPLPDK